MFNGIVCAFHMLTWSSNWKKTVAHCSQSCAGDSIDHGAIVTNWYILKGVWEVRELKSSNLSILLRTLCVWVVALNSQNIFKGAFHTSWCCDVNINCTEMENEGETAVSWFPYFELLSKPFNSTWRYTGWVAEALICTNTTLLWMLVVWFSLIKVVSLQSFDCT